MPQDSNKENKITYEELAPSLQDLLKQFNISDIIQPVDNKLETLSTSIQALLDAQKSPEIWDVMHRYGSNYIPTDISNSGWVKLGICSINYTTQKIQNQPSNKGQLINIPFGDPKTGSEDSTQIWISQPGGNVFVRAAGSDGSSINTKPFTPISGGGSSGNEAFPVGSVFLTMKKGNPSEQLGYGSWRRIQDAYLYASNSNKDINTSDRVGKKTISLTKENLPNITISGTTSTNGDHHHGSWAEKRDDEWRWPFGDYDIEMNHPGSGKTDYDNGLYNTTTDGAHSHTFESDPIGNNEPIKNSPLGIPVFMWVRES